MVLLIIFLLLAVSVLYFLKEDNQEVVVQNFGQKWISSKAVLVNKRETVGNPTIYEITLRYVDNEYTFEVTYDLYRKYPPLREVPIMIRPDGNKYEVKISKDA